MNEQPLSPDAELASVFLDGDVDDAQRAAALGSPDVMEQVEAFSTIRARLADVPEPDADRRDAAIAAALAGVGAATVTSIATKQRWMTRALSGAAAAAVVAIVGVAVLNSGGNDTNTTADMSQERNADAAPAETVVALEASGGADNTPRPTIGNIPTAADPIVALESVDDILAYAKDGVAGTASTDVASTATPPCDGYEMVGEMVLYQGQQAFVVRDGASGNLQVVDAMTCAVLEEVQP